MKHAFLLDENIIYCAIKCVNDQEKEDTTALNLIYYIIKNCHFVVYDLELCRRYSTHLDKLKNKREYIPSGIDTLSIVKSLLYQYVEKAKIKFEKAPPLSEENSLPVKDIHIVRALIHCGAEILVTYDEKLRNVINSKFSHISLQALSPVEAIKYAKEGMI